ncbi:MAG: peptide chain release factor N(5)-glutamine methyltransferase [Proteobacteria bacterium]|nr:peptide chain release factor N(5)-glutamine methyltransferase [Pseudomonadota bacterium]
MSRSWTVLELLRWTSEHFASKGIETARLDAECLLAHALGTTRLKLYVEFEKPVLEEERARFRELVRRRAAERVPVSQLLGEKEFWSLPFQVTPDVLTPRPDTETLVEAALALAPETEAPLRILDLGTGSGAIALSLATERPKAHVVAIDTSEAALQIAAQNADRLRLSDRVRFAAGDLFEPVRGEEFDLVVSNPPYLARAEAAGLPPELAHEPEAALFAGDDGFAVLAPLVDQVGEVLAPGGAFAVEAGSEQVEAVAERCRRVGLEAVEVRRDLARQPRVVVARRGES